MFANYKKKVGASELNEDHKSLFKQVENLVCADYSNLNRTKRPPENNQPYRGAIFMGFF